MNTSFVELPAPIGRAYFLMGSSAGLSSHAGSLSMGCQFRILLDPLVTVIIIVDRNLSFAINLSNLNFTPRYVHNDGGGRRVGISAIAPWLII
jgi:hypothetical protein